MLLNDKTYETLKWLVCIVLPALGVFYSAMAALWGWPFADQVPKTLQAVALLLGSTIGISTAEYRRQTKE